MSWAAYLAIGVAIGVYVLVLIVIARFLSFAKGDENEP